MTAENIESTVVVFDGEVGDVLRSVSALLTQTSASMFLGCEQPEKKPRGHHPQIERLGRKPQRRILATTRVLQEH